MSEGKSLRLQEVVSMMEEEINAVELMEGLAKEVAGLQAENDKLRRLLAESTGACAYCALPSARMGECAHGFPGCPRADDMALDGGPTMTPEMDRELELSNARLAGFEAGVAHERARIVAWMREQSAKAANLADQWREAGKDVDSLSVLINSASCYETAAFAIEAAAEAPAEPKDARSVGTEGNACRVLESPGGPFAEDYDAGSFVMEGCRFVNNTTNRGTEGIER